MYYNQKIEDVSQQLKTDLRNGLNQTEVKQRQKEYGFNEIKGEKKQPMMIRFLLQFKDALTIILILAAIISIVVDPGEWIDSAIIVFVVIVNAILGLIQESNAEKSLEALQKMASPMAKVIRDGHTMTINASDVVPGDLLVLEAGYCIASDARII